MRLRRQWRRTSPNGENGPDGQPLYFGAGPTSIAAAATYAWPSPADNTGIVYVHVQISMADVLDGASYTFMLGEKYLNPDYYATGTSEGDDQGPFLSDCRDAIRYASIGPSTDGFLQNAPMQDHPGLDYTWNYGSAHADAFNAALCDASVRSVSYNIDEIAHRRLCNRKDGQPVDENKF